MTSPDSRRRAARALVAMGVALGLVSILGWVALAPLGPVSAHARVEIAPHFLPEASEGRLAAVVVLVLDAPARESLLARGVEADVSLAGVPVGRLVAKREDGSLTAAPSFRLTVEIRAPAPTPALTRVADAVETRPGTVELRIDGRVLFGFGDESPLVLRERVRLVFDTSLGTSMPTPAAFSPSEEVPRGPEAPAHA